MEHVHEKVAVRRELLHFRGVSTLYVPHLRDNRGKVLLERRYGVIRRGVADNLEIRDRLSTGMSLFRNMSRATCPSPPPSACIARGAVGAPRCLVARRRPAYEPNTDPKIQDECRVR
jgi:hypothetical protein